MLFNWLKRKKKQKEKCFSPAQAPALAGIPLTRDELVASALKNMQETRLTIGEENLKRLAYLILEKKETVDDTSPAAQAKKIIATMDKDKLNDFMKLMVHDNQTKH